MSDNDVSQIKDRLTKIEVQVVEKWSSHDKRSDERWTDLMEKFHEMAKKLDHRPCMEHAELLLSVKHRMEALEKWQSAIHWAIGVIYVAGVGIVLNSFLRHL